MDGREVFLCVFRVFGFFSFVFYGVLFIFVLISVFCLILFLGVIFIYKMIVVNL